MQTVLFFDDWMLSKRTNMVRCPGRPRWIPEATLDEAMCDATWNRPTVFRLKESGIWRAVYSGVTFENGNTIPLGMMVAESDDGIHWIKPDISKQLELSDRRLPNQVYHAISGGPAFFDELEPDPRYRLKYLYASPRATPDKRLIYLTSPDGIVWNETGTWGGRQLDAPVSIFYNSNRITYIIVNRPALGDRRVAFIETKDFKTFSEPQLVLSPDPDDVPLTEFYGMTVFPYDNIYIGLLQIMHTEPEELSKRCGYAEGGLTYSYDGINFNRFTHSSFIKRNERSEQGGGTVYPSSMVIDDSYNIRIYSGASRATHFQSKELVDAALIMHTLRLDGFAYLEPAGLKGTITTRKLCFTGDKLLLNIRAPYGSVKVQISDNRGIPLDGFIFSDCIPFVGDALFHEPKWTGGSTLSNLLGREVHIEVEIIHGEIYAIRGDFNFLKITL